MPRWETIIEARDRWIERNPNLTIVAAHLGSLSHDVDEVAARLDKFPNLYVETAARFKDLTIQPSEKVRAFMVKYQDRVLYGTDVSNGTVEREGMDAFFDRQWNYMSRSDSVSFGDPGSWFVKTQGLGLPRQVLDKFYAGNVSRLLDL
jgi:predicted TIM-barrel fold metal-dependent hydrolase